MLLPVALWILAVILCEHGLGFEGLTVQ